MVGENAWDLGREVIFDGFIGLPANLAGAIWVAGTLIPCASLV
jgi:hypothetical protein